jgi:hypothetical protein
MRGEIFAQPSSFIRPMGFKLQLQALTADSWSSSFFVFLHQSFSFDDMLWWVFIDSFCIYLSQTNANEPLQIHNILLLLLEHSIQLLYLLVLATTSRNYWRTFHNPSIFAISNAFSMVVVSSRPTVQTSSDLLTRLFTTAYFLPTENPAERIELSSQL